MSTYQTSRRIPLSPGAQNASFVPFDTRNDHFTKTGSGQTHGKLKTEMRFFRRLQMNGMKGSDSDILQSNVDGLSASGGAAPNQSSVSRAARLLFTAPTCGVCVYDPVYACAYYGCCCCSAASLACASVLVYSFSSFSVVFGSVCFRFRFRFRFSMA